MFKSRYLVLLALGLALARTYRVALSNHLDGDPGWLSFVAVWLPAAIVLGLIVAYVAPAVAWRLRGSQAAASAGRERSMFGAGGSFWAWVLPFGLAVVGGALLAREDWLPGACLCAAALIARALQRRADRSPTRSER